MKKKEQVSGVQGYNEALKRLNYENKLIMNSKEYRLGSKIYTIVGYMKSLDIAGLLKVRKIAKKNKVVKTMYRDISLPVNPKPKETFYLDLDAGERITVYTCIVGRYDVPKQPLIKSSNCEFVLFTDKDIKDVDGWNIRTIPDKIKKYSPTEINRYMKFHPGEFFDTRYAVYIDGNVRVISELSDLCDCINDKTGLAMYRHSQRICLYREAEACTLLKKGNIEKIKEQVKKYSVEGMPHDFGLVEATVIVVDLKNVVSSSLLEQWWMEFVKMQSGRDQLAFPYILWKNKYKMSDIGMLGNDVKNDLHYQISVHS
jgi:hypothetical protein